MTDHRHVPQRREFSFWWPVAVRWGDMDALGHVNNTLYLQYLESARIGFFEGIGWGMDRFAAEGHAPVVVSQTFHYRRQVTYPATLDVGLRCKEVRQRSLVLEFGVFRAGTDEVVGNGSTVLAWTDLAAGRAVALPADLRARLADGPPAGVPPPAS
jgi:acyl-CoA thioester hydrolase